MQTLINPKLAIQPPPARKGPGGISLILIGILVFCCILLCCCAVAAVLLFSATRSRGGISPTTVVIEKNNVVEAGPVAVPVGSGEVLVQPSADPQTFTFGDASVTIPGGLLSTSETLRVTRLSDPPAANLPALGIGAAYEIRLGEQHQFDQPIEIRLRYDPSQIRDDLAIERSISLAYYDEDQGVWVETPSKIDLEKQEIAVAATHLTKWGWFMWARGYQVYEDNTFTLVYDLSELNDPALGPVYRPADDSNHVDPNVPDYVEDTLAYLNFAYHRYKAAGFKTPPTPINVYVGGSNPSQRGKFFGHGLSINLNSVSQAQLKLDTAHELFHSFQGAYLTAVGMGSGELPIVGWTVPVLSWSVWYIEGSAEYAAEYVAWDGALGLMGGLKNIQPDYLSYPLWDISENHSYGYHTAHFIKFLVDGGADFKTMSEYLFNYDWSNLNDYYYPLHEYLESVHGLGNGLPRQYQGFARFFVFDAGSPMPALVDSLHTEVAAYRTTMSGNPQESAAIDLKGSYTAKLWGIWFSDTLFGQGSSTRQYKVSLDSALPAKVEADVYVLKGDKKVVGGATPAGTLNQATTSVDVQVEKGDAVYVLAVNTSSQDSQVKIKITENSGLKVTSNRDNGGPGDYTPTIHTEWLVEAPGATLAPEGSGAMVYVSAQSIDVRGRVVSTAPAPDFEGCYNGECSKFTFNGFTGVVELWAGGQLLATASGPGAWMEASVSLAGIDYADVYIRVYYSATYKRWNESTGDILSDEQKDDDYLQVGIPVEKK